MNRNDVIYFIKHETQLLDESAGEFISSCEELIRGTWDVTFEEQLTIRIETTIISNSREKYTIFSRVYESQKRNL